MHLFSSRRRGLVLLALLGFASYLGLQPGADPASPARLIASEINEASATEPVPAPSSEAPPASAVSSFVGGYLGQDLPVWRRASATADPDLAAFPEWTVRWFATPESARDSALLDEGLALARQRRQLLRQLIPQDPAAALAAATPYSVRRALPPEFLPLLEEAVSGAHAYDVIIACGGDHGTPGHSHAVERYLTVGDSRLVAFTYGERLDTTTKQSLSVHGIAVDELAALHADPVRLLSAAEATDRGLDPAVPHAEIAGRIHRLADESALAAWTAALRADERRLGPFPGPAHRAAATGAPSPESPVHATPPGTSSDDATPQTTSAPPTADSAWTEGPKTMLYIRARFADEAADYVPLQLGTAQGYQTVVDQYWQSASYGKSSITTTYTDVVTLPGNASSYTDAFGTLLSHATAAAKSANPQWDSAQFNLYAVITSNKGGFAYAGKAWVGSAGVHLRADYSSLRTAGHEYGHNLGLWHAGYWRTDCSSPIGRDTAPGGYVSDGVGDERIEYGHRFSLMSAQHSAEFNNATMPHFSVVEKLRLDWITPASGLATLASTPATGTTLRIYRQDHPAASGTRGVCIDLPSSDYSSGAASAKRRYWLSYRRAFTADIPGIYSPHGLEVEWARTSYGSDGAIQLDMTPFTRDATTFIHHANPPANFWTIDNSDKEDAQLPLGLTYSDHAAGIHFTPIATGDDDGVAHNGNEWIEVDVRLGHFPGNRPPSVTLTASTTTPAVGGSVTFTAVASDPDGDALSYWWDFADNMLHVPALNNPSPTKSWSSAGVRVVRVIVSDRKGGQTIAQLPITVGAAANTSEIRGRVIHGGRPVAGARVHVGDTYQTWTDSDGRYILAGLPAGNHTLTARKHGLTLSPRFTNPVSTASGAQYGRDFHANETLALGGGAYSVSGTVTNLGVRLAGVVVEGGGLRTTTDSNGNYTLSGLTDGTYSLSARLAPYTFTPAAAPITLSGSDLAGVNFSVQRFTVSGSINGIGNDPGATSSATIFLLDGTTAISGRQGGSGRTYTLSVPTGNWSVFASLPGHALTPAFTNPLAVTGDVAQRDFTGTPASSTHAIVGTVTFNGQALAGTTVTLSGPVNATTVTDAGGRYRFANLPATAATVTASRAGYAFAPASVSVAPTASGAVADFTAISTSAATAAPEVEAVGASPATAPIGGTVTLSAVASGPGPLTYRWAATSAPGPVAFSVNDSASAATTVATLSHPGNYTFSVIVTDANGFTATGSAHAFASGGLAALVLSPFEVVVAAGGSVTFRADAFDGAGAPAAASPVFSVSGGGSIHASSGVFQATGGGTHTITATVGGLACTATVTVLGDIADTAPTITSPGAQAIKANGTTGALAFTVGDAETPADSLVVTPVSSDTALIPLAGIVLGGSGAQRTVTITPAANRAGTATITLAVSDGALDAQTSFTVTVTETMDSWINTQPGVGAFTAPEDDPDGDGFPNLLEYALGSAPGSASSAPRMETQVVALDPEGSYLVFTFTPARTQGLLYVIEASSDLASWTGEPLTNLQPGEPHTHIDTVPIGTAGRRFLRLKVTQD